MRDIAITLIVFIGCAYTFKRTYIGVLLWSWLSYMNPHRLAYGFAYSMPFAQMSAIALLVSTLFTKEKKALPINSITVVWLFYILFMGITTIFAYFPDQALPQYIKVIKIQLIVFLTMMLITDMDKLKHLIWVIVLSLGYYSVKGGVFTLMSGGGFKVWGPEGSFIEDNNHLAIAILMTIPLMVFLQLTADKRWIKHGLTIAIVLSLFTVLGSQSRGALLAITAVGALYWLKSERKIVSGIFITVLAVIMAAFMPDSWHERMNTINDYQEDSSTLGRFNAWEYAFNSANHNLLGMGFDSWSPDTFLLYAPDPTDVHAAHSIYFSVLADHGWIGLGLFLLVFKLGTKQVGQLVKETTNIEALKEVNLLAKMLQVSFIAYFVGGTFLSLSYFDLPWHLLSFIVLLRTFLDNKQAEQLQLRPSSINTRITK